VHTGLWLGDLRERYYMEDPGVEGTIILTKIDLQEVVWRGHGLD
jgi:hypothetical protein